MIRLRHHGLESLTRRYLAEAARLDFSPEEVSESILQNIRSWQEQGSPPRPDIDEA
jgi:hypothetical protein